MTKLETIEKRQILTESEDRPDAKKKETTWTDKSGKKHPATQVQGHQSVKADKESDKEKKKHDLDEMSFQGAIANALLKEFDIAVDEAEEQQEQELDEADNPWANDPAKAAAWAALSPEDQKWLGGADPTDQFILARAPNKGKPATARSIGAGTKPADTPAPAAAPTSTQVQTDDEGNHLITTPDGKTMVVGPDGKPLPNSGKEAPAASATAAPPAGGAGGDAAVAKTRERMKALLDKLEKTGGVSGSPAAPATGTAAKPATGAATKPATGGSTMPAVDPMGNATGMPAKESVTYQDDQILALIRGL